jgi:serine/threonine-protein kinase
MAHTHLPHFRLPPFRLLWPGLLLGALGLSLAGASLAASSKAAAAKKKTAYGAIAWHRGSSSVGYSYDFPTARQAGVEALKQCGHPQCEVVLPLHNECGALASGNKGFAARKGYTEAEAQTKAVSACGPDCRAVAWACTK